MFLKFQNKFEQIIDLGTGSGCIILSILKDIETLKGTAVDISEKALKIAKLFNQESILDWSKSKNKDNPYFIDNPFYKKDKKLTKEDYYNGIKELKNDKNWRI